jgi:hypothetical protein
VYQSSPASDQAAAPQCRGDIRPVELEDLLPLPPDLNPHAINFAPDMIDVRHASPSMIRDAESEQKENKEFSLAAGISAMMGFQFL